MIDRDVRRAKAAWVNRSVAALDGFNQRHPWSHNDHFHGWVLRNLPRHRRSALEVGCGRGELASALSSRFDHVRAIDADAEMAGQAKARLDGIGHVDVEQSSFLDEQGSHDLITMVAVLHHLELAPALEHAKRLLAPGGRLLVVGLSRMESKRDFAWDTASALLNPIIGLLKHPRAASPVNGAPYPIADAVLTTREIEPVVERLLPGAQLRRRLFFRHTLKWEKPREHGW